MADAVSGLGAGTSNRVTSVDSVGGTPLVRSVDTRWGAGVVIPNNGSNFVPLPAANPAPTALPVAPEGVGLSPGQMNEAWGDYYKKLEEEAARQALTQKPPTLDEMNAMLADGTLDSNEAARMTNASRQDKLAMLESWGMKPKHTNKDPVQVDALFQQVVGEMQQGPHAPKEYRVRFAGKKFRLQIIKDSATGKLKAVFKRKKPKFSIRRLFKKVIGGITGFVSKAFQIINPINWAVSGVSSIMNMGRSVMGLFGSGGSK